jgi:hypothetical protein
MEPRTATGKRRGARRWPALAGTQGLVFGLLAFVLAPAASASTAGSPTTKQRGGESSIRERLERNSDGARPWDSGRERRPNRSRKPAEQQDGRGLFNPCRVDPKHPGCEKSR